MQRFTFLCRLDDQRNELQALYDNLSSFMTGEQVPPSDIPYWRNEFYEDMAAILILDQDCFGEGSEYDILEQ